MKRYFILFVLCLAVCGAYAQSIVVRGTITDQKGEALPGVSVVLEGTKTGTVSDINGQYAITVPNSNTKLVISSVGLQTQTITVGGRNSINIKLLGSATDLQEVVVTGYGVQQAKPTITGAVSTIDVKELRRATTSNLSNSLGGRIPGLITRMGDGAIGGVQTRYSNGGIDDAQIYIRGKGTLNQQSALVLIDDVEGSLSRISPEDIESISVLKDASATAVYGVRGANGVILVTTRKGVIGKPQISANTQVRYSQPLAYPKFLGAYDYATLYNEAQRNQGVTPLRFSDDDLKAIQNGSDPYGANRSDIDWRKVLTKDHFIEQVHTGNISGGTDKVRYYVSGEYNQSGYIFIGNKANDTDYDYRRYNLRSNLDFNLTKSTKFTVQLNGLLNDLTTPIKPESSGQRVNGLGWADVSIRTPVEGQIYNPNGSYNVGSSNTWNAVMEFLDGGTIRRLSNTLSANLLFKQDLNFITKGLSVRGLYGTNYGAGATKQLNRNPNLYAYNPTTGAYTLGRAEVVPNYSAVGDQFQNYTRTQQVQAAVDYNTTFGKDHKVTGMLLANQSTREVQGILPRYYQGVAARATYGFKGKYLVDANVGYNGSDAFNKDNRFAFFPSGSAGWVISEEAFVKKNLKFLNFLKIRGSYGEVGNDLLGSSFQYFYIYNFAAPAANTTSSGSALYNLGVTQANQNGLREGTLANDQVTWETAKKSDLGLEFKLFNSRFSFSGDYFYEKRSDILSVRSDIPTYSGFNSFNTKLPGTNLARVVNRGLEFVTGWSDNSGKVDYSVEFNFTHAKNKVLYKGEVPRKYPWQVETGHQIGAEALYTWTGEFSSTGELVMADLNGDGRIDTDDRAVQGYTETPETFGGLIANIGYKGFSLSTQWYGATNVAYRADGNIRFEFAQNVQPFHLERWVYDPARGLDTRATAKYPALAITGSATTRLASTFHKLNAEYLRLRTVEFGYQFPDALVKKLRVQRLRVFASGSNLLTFSHMKKYYLDPEMIGKLNPDAPDTNGSSGAYSPQNKFYALGLNVTF